MKAHRSSNKEGLSSGDMSKGRRKLLEGGACTGKKKRTLHQRSARCSKEREKERSREREVKRSRDRVEERKKVKRTRRHDVPK